MTLGKQEREILRIIDPKGRTHSNTTAITSHLTITFPQTNQIVEECLSS